MGPGSDRHMAPCPRPFGMQDPMLEPGCQMAPPPLFHVADSTTVGDTNRSDARVRMWGQGKLPGGNNISAQRSPFPFEWGGRSTTPFSASPTPPPQPTMQGGGNEVGPWSPEKGLMRDFGFDCVPESKVNHLDRWAGEKALQDEIRNVEEGGRKILETQHRAHINDEGDLDSIFRLWL